LSYQNSKITQNSATLNFPVMIKTTISEDLHLETIGLSIIENINNFSENEVLLTEKLQPAK
jgi:hypothetical protein